ncbi:MAG: hypothetical protein HN348_32240, partial [Proteobacteria bacterium]|nr:hypothetical protein [Pseudomonadota bacterium]
KRGTPALYTGTGTRDETVFTITVPRSPYDDVRVPIARNGRLGNLDCQDIDIFEYVVNLALRGLNRLRVVTGISWLETHENANLVSAGRI